jgi:hypothetical protein
MIRFREVMVARVEGVLSERPGGRALASCRIGSLDLWILAGLSLVAFTLFISSPQARSFGDGSWMLALVRNDGPLFRPHPLYAVLLRALGTLFPETHPAIVVRGLSATCSALACGGMFLLCRSSGCGRLASTAAVAMVSGTPAVWFFATTVEMHALPLFAVSWAGCAIVFLPWRRFGLALTGAALAVAATYLAHPTAALVGFGWVWLIRACTKCETGERLSWQRSALVVVPVLGVTAYVLLAGLRWLTTDELPGLGGGQEWKMLRIYSDVSRAPDMLWYGMARPLALLPLIALLGAMQAPGVVRWICLAALAPPFLILGFLYTVSEWGGFFLGSVPFLAVLVAFLFERIVTRKWLIGLIVAAQFGLSYVQIAAYNSVLRIPDRAAHVREVIGESGLLVADGGLAPEIKYELPGVSEIGLHRTINRAVAAGTSPADFAPSCEWFLKQSVANGPVALDRSYALEAGRRGLPFDITVHTRLPYYEALEQMLRERYTVESFDHPSWPLLLIRQKRDDRR